MSLLVFEPYAGGHQGLYLDALVTYYREQRIGHPLDLVVTRAFGERHPATWAHLQEAEGVTTHVVDDAPAGASLLSLDARNGEVFERFITQLRPAHALSMYVDHLQVSLGRGLRFDFPTRISGVYFRPSFHYGALGGPSAGLKDRVMALRKRAVLRWARRNPHLDTLFSLDPFAAQSINRMAGHGSAVFLPDPVPIPDPSATPAPSILDDVPQDRRTLLLFGVLDARKGIAEVAAALHHLSAANQRRLTLALAGPLDAQLRPTIDALLDGTQIDVRLDDRFVPDAEIQRLIGHSDLVLLTYQRHIGSSNVLVRSAAAGVPVLSTDYGLVGAQVRTRRLGLTVDASDPGAIARALTAWLTDPSTVAFDASSAAAFHAQNTAEAYARTLFDALSF